MIENNDEWLKLDAAAKLLSVSPSTIKNWRKLKGRAKIPFKKRGNVVRYPRKGILAWWNKKN